jgi:hypothetical protein
LPWLPQATLLYELILENKADKDQKNEDNFLDARKADSGYVVDLSIFVF